LSHQIIKTDGDKKGTQPGRKGEGEILTALRKERRREAAKTTRGSGTMEKTKNRLGEKKKPPCFDPEGGRGNPLEARGGARILLGSTKGKTNRGKEDILRKKKREQNWMLPFKGRGVEYIRGC